MAELAQTASTKDILHKSWLFEQLTDEELDKVVALCHEEAYEAGTVIFTEGTLAKNVYVIKEGTVALETSFSLRPGMGKQGTVDVISKGMTFGWSALSGSRVLTMSARCLSRTEVFALYGGHLQLLFSSHPAMGYKVMNGLVKTVSSRLRHAKDTLAEVLYIATHDLKAPLGAVQSYIQVMLGGYVGEVSEKQKDMLQRSSERITSLIDLIDNILDISHIEATTLDRRTVLLRELLLHCVESIRPLAEEKGLRIDVELPPQFSPIQGSPERLQQVVMNLLNNAVKFTDEGVITLRAVEDADLAWVEVIDTGIGIAAEELPKIFDDFYRGRSLETKGAGLGLSIARRIVEAHGGKIWAESPCPESGQGTKFTFTLPKVRIAE